MAELARYVDEQGNVFSTTAAEAKRRGLKPFAGPGGATAEATEEAPADAEAKATDAPPATTSRRTPPADKSG